jgi:hypothetical protein
MVVDDPVACKDESYSGFSPEVLRGVCSNKHRANSIPNGPKNTFNGGVLRMLSRVSDMDFDTLSLTIGFKIGNEILRSLVQSYRFYV